MRDAGVHVVMCAAAGDAELAEACETLVRDAVNDALGTVEDGADVTLAGGVAGQRFREALTSHKTADVEESRRRQVAIAPGPGKARATVKQVEQRADAFRRMTGVRR